MKKSIVILFGFFALVSCNQGQKKAQEAQEVIEEIIVGNDEDEHGCKPSTGETWSEVKHACVRIFDEGTRLNPISQDDTAVISAFVLFNDDKSAAEIFVAGDDSKVIDKTAENIYQADQYRYDDKDGILYINEVAVYKK
ncbi:MAG: hypothetical protein Q4G08_06100 [Capnocytophaga sp.]|nr:hypothetical protein [Capnocytophaga sp.]